MREEWRHLTNKIRSLGKIFSASKLKNSSLCLLMRWENEFLLLLAIAILQFILLTSLNLKHVELYIFTQSTKQKCNEIYTTYWKVVHNEWGVEERRKHPKQMESLSFIERYFNWISMHEISSISWEALAPLFILKDAFHLLLIVSVAASVCVCVLFMCQRNKFFTNLCKF
jgi:hypothetical protein